MRVRGNEIDLGSGPLVAFGVSNFEPLDSGTGASFSFGVDCCYMRQVSVKYIL